MPSHDATIECQYLGFQRQQLGAESGNARARYFWEPGVLCIGDDATALSGGTLEVTSGGSVGAVLFGDTGTLQLDSLMAFGGTISGFQLGDGIEAVSVGTNEIRRDQTYLTLNQLE